MEIKSTSSTYKSLLVCCFACTYIFIYLSVFNDVVQKQSPIQYKQTQLWCTPWVTSSIACSHYRITVLSTNYISVSRLFKKFKNKLWNDEFNLLSIRSHWLFTGGNHVCVWCTPWVTPSITYSHYRITVLSTNYISASRLFKKFKNKLWNHESDLLSIRSHWLYAGGIRVCVERPRRWRQRTCKYQPSLTYSCYIQVAIGNQVRLSCMAHACMYLFIIDPMAIYIVTVTFHHCSMSSYFTSNHDNNFNMHASRREAKVVECNWWYMYMIWNVSFSFPLS